MASDSSSNSGLGGSFGDHGYHDQIEAVLGEILALEKDGAWKYHSVKQNVLISQMKGASESSKRAFGPYHPVSLEEEKKQKEFQKVRGQGIVHAPPETTFNCISDLDMYDMWDGFSSEHTVIAEYPLSDQGLIRILYIRFNGIFPLASRDLCVCTVKRAIFSPQSNKPPRSKSKDPSKRSSSLWPSSPDASSPTPRSRSVPAESFKSDKSILSPSQDSLFPSPKETSIAEADAYVLVAFSIDHPSCPRVPGFVRADLAASGFIIRPHPHSSCSEVTYTLQFNAKGWLPTALSSLVSEYQPLRIAKIRDIAQTYQYTKRSSHSNKHSSPQLSSHLRVDPLAPLGSIPESSAISSTSSSSSSSITGARFGWIQQCRGVAREEEEFIAQERQRLEEASMESSKPNSSRPTTLLRGVTQSTLHPSPTRNGENHQGLSVSQHGLQPGPQKQRHTRSVSSGGKSGSDHAEWTSGKQSHQRSGATTSTSSVSASGSPRSGSASSDTFWTSSSHGKAPSSLGLKSSMAPLHMSDGAFHTGHEGEGGEGDWNSASRRPRPRTMMPSSTKNLVSMSGDSDSENGDTDADSEDSETFFDVSSDLHSTELLYPGSEGSMVVLKMMEHDVDHIKGVQLASQEKLEAIEDNLKNRSVDNARLLDHLEGLRAFLVACMEKLKTYSTEHKTMEAIRLRMESKWHAKLASVSSKLNDAQRGYWSSRRARQAVVYRYSTLFFILVVWPIIFIKMYGWFKKPQKALFNLLRWTRLFSDWLLPSIPFDSD